MVVWLRDYYSTYPLTLIVQIVAIPFYFLSFWTKKKTFRFLTVITSVFYAIGYFSMAAWSGLTLAIITAVICLIVNLVEKKYGSVSDKHSRHLRLLLLLLFSIGNILIYTYFEDNLYAITMVVASILNYYNYFMMKENNIATKVIFIFSHILIVFYEIIVNLYFFALIDFLVTLSIGGALIIDLRKTIIIKPIQSFQVKTLISKKEDFK
jgi:hypothetical protein